MPLYQADKLGVTLRDYQIRKCGDFYNGFFAVPGVANEVPATQVLFTTPPLVTRYAKLTPMVGDLGGTYSKTVDNASYTITATSEDRPELNTHLMQRFFTDIEKMQNKLFNVLPRARPLTSIGSQGEKLLKFSKRIMEAKLPQEVRVYNMQGALMEDTALEECDICQIIFRPCNPYKKATEKKISDDETAIYQGGLKFELEGVVFVSNSARRETPDNVFAYASIFKSV